jgi:integrase
MAKITGRLTELAVKNAKPEIRKDGTISKTTLLPDGDGLYLQLSIGTKAPEREPDETLDAYRERLLTQMLDGGILFSRSWVFRSAVGGRETRIGLGAYPGVTLAKARESAKEQRDSRDRGTNPLKAKQQKEAAGAKAEQEREAAEARANAHGTTFAQAAAQYIAGQEAGWSNPSYRAQWKQSLKDYAYPLIGDLPVAEVTAELVLQVIEPYWKEKTKTMADLRARIAKVLNFAAIKGYRPKGQNPAAWKDNLEVSLAKPSRVTPVVNHPALPYAKIGAFMAELRKNPSIVARALEFTILYASRVGEVRFARWSEIDLKARLWTIPASRMKAREEHNVPLSERACAILEAIEGDTIPHPATLVFNKMGRRLALNAALKLACQMEPGITLHGFRSTFRDWVGDETEHRREIAEFALAHKVVGVEGDYRRGKALRKRRRLMEDWAQYCATIPAESADADRVA